MRIHGWLAAWSMLLGAGALAQEEVPRPEGVGRAADEVSEGVREGQRAMAGARSPLPMGMLEDGREVKNTITASATGLFVGQGLNATYERPLREKFSGLVGASFSRTRAADGAVTNVGALVGVDWFPIGRHNEGLRLGPRVNLGVGSETIGENTSFISVGIAGELGYNWIASNGLTAGAAAGIRGDMGGISKQEGFDWGWNPYGSLNVGYSW